MSGLLHIDLWWTVLLAFAAAGSCAAIGTWFAAGRAPASLAAVPALLVGTLLSTTTLYDPPLGPEDRVDVTSILGVPVFVSRSQGYDAERLFATRPAFAGTAVAAGLGALFLLAMWRLGRPVPPLRVDAAGLTWWPVRRNGVVIAVALLSLAVPACWLLSHTDEDVPDLPFRPAIAVDHPLNGVGAALLGLLGVLAWIPGGPAFRRVRLTSDAVLLEPADGRTVQIALLDLAYAEMDTRGLLRHRGLVLHVGHTEIRRTHIVCADGSSDEEVDGIRAAIMEAKVRASARPAEVPEPPEELLAMRRSPSRGAAARSRAVSEP